MEVPASASWLPARFDIVDRLGEGGLGVVYRARDRVSRSIVALKRLRSTTPESLYLLKREFRALRRVRHPNLVRYYELFAATSPAFFSMELVDGEPLVGWIRGDLPTGAPLDEDGMERLRSGCFQLASALEACHAAGRVHRDIKPENVLVTGSGRVVLIDFGLSALRGEPVGGARDSRRGLMEGTLAYMSPEQILGLGREPSTDWYALGVLLFEALVGELPFPSESPAEKLRPGPPDLPGLAGRAGPLETLVRALLEPDPLRRAEFSRVADTLAPGAPPRERAMLPNVDLIGRDEERARIQRWLDEPGTTPVFVLEGESGVGKTALAEDVARRWLASGGRLLGGRCDPQESVPFKALDGIVDGLVRDLILTAPRAAEFVGRPAVASLEALFPVVGRLDPHAVSRRVESGDLPGPGRHQEAMETLVELLALAGREQALLLYVDDFHWADSDSLRLLTELLRERSRVDLRLLVTARDLEGTPADAWLHEHAGQCAVERVTPLASAAARAVAAGVLGEDADADHLDRIAVAAGGSPFWIHELARLADAPGGPGAPDQAIARRVDGLEPGLRWLVVLPCLARAPLSVAALSSLVELLSPGRDTSAALFALYDARLLAPRELDGERGVVPFHDRVAGAVSESLDADRTREGNRLLADLLADSSDSRFKLRMDAELAAGRTDRAIEAGRRGLRRALSGMAWRRALGIADNLLDLDPRSLDGARGRARALAALGRGVDSAAAHQQAADLARQAGDPELALRLELGATEQFIRVGRYAQGRARLDSVLRALGVQLPESTPAVVAGIVRLRLSALVRLPHRRALGSSEHRDLLREALWSAATSLALYDQALAEWCALQHRRIAGGDASEELRAGGLEAVFRARLRGTPLGRTALPRAHHVVRKARERGDPETLAWALMFRGCVHWMGADHEDVMDDAATALRLFEEVNHGTAWERAATSIWLTSALWFGGDFEGFERVVQGGRRAAIEADQHFWDDAGMYHPVVVLDLVRDNPDAARRTLADIERRWGENKPPVSAWSLGSAWCDIHLYEGDGERGLAALDRYRGVLRRTGATLSPRIVLEVRWRRALSALMAAQSVRAASRRGRRLLRSAAADARRMRRSRLPMSRAMGEVLSLAVASERSGRRPSDDHLAAVGSRCESSGLSLLGAAVRRTAHPSSAAEPERGSGWLAARGARDPVRLLRILCPRLDARPAS